MAPIRLRKLLERCLEEISIWEPKIGAFVHLNLDAARDAADQSDARWRDGRPLSPIDGMPIGIKDIIETVDMPTENGSPLFVGFRSERDAASVAALREAGAVIIGKTVTTEFAATEPRGTRNPHDLRRTPGGSSSGSAAGGRSRDDQRRARHPGDRLDHPPGELLRLRRPQGLGRRAQPRRQLRRPEPKRRPASSRRRSRMPGRSLTRSRCAPAAIRDIPACTAPRAHRRRAKPTRIAFLQTAGWTAASADAKEAMRRRPGTLQSRRHRGLDARESHSKLAAVEDAITAARTLSMRLNAWEWRWPLNTYRERDASKLSRAMLDRLAEAEAMTLDDYRR